MDSGPRATFSLKNKCVIKHHNNCLFCNDILSDNSSRRKWHYEKCRTRYILRLIGEEKPVIKARCQYNCGLSLLDIEREFHEKSCKERDYIWSFELSLNPLLKDEYVMNVCDTEQRELDKMYDGFFINTFIGSAHAGPLPKTFEDVFDAKRDKTLMEGIGVGELAPGTSSRMTGSVPNTSMTNKNARFNRKASANVDLHDIGAVGGVEDEEEDEWNPRHKKAKFDWLESVSNPKRPLWRYPPGLTWNQRRQYDNFNTEWTQNNLAEYRRQLQDTNEGLQQGPPALDWTPMARREVASSSGSGKRTVARGPTITTKTISTTTDGDDDLTVSLQGLNFN